MKNQTNEKHSNCFSTILMIFAEKKLTFKTFFVKEALNAAIKTSLLEKLG